MNKAAAGGGSQMREVYADREVTMGPNMETDDERMLPGFPKA